MRKIKRTTPKKQVEAIIKKQKYFCERCKHKLSNYGFETKEEFNRHKEEMHGEYSINDKSRDPKIKEQVFLYKEKTTSNRCPHRSEWIQTVGDITYWWNPWLGNYYKYIKGIGCITNDVPVMIFCDENSKYFKVWKGIVCNLHKLDNKREPTREKLKAIL